MIYGIILTQATDLCQLLYEKMFKFDLKNKLIEQSSK